MELAALTARLHQRIDLEDQEIEAAANALASADVGDEPKAEFLTALAHKGETPGEVAAFARAFRDRAIDPQVSEWAVRGIDVVGTGGDRTGTFNISTATLFVVAAAGVPVLKHGNRSITSKCGSADFLEALGVKIDAPAAVQRRALAELGLCFFFAPAYHPAFKQVAGVRRTLATRGQRTIFNLLGPLINPARPAHQLLGVFAASWVQPLAGALERIGLAAAAVVHGEIEPGRGVDELTSVTVNHVAGSGRLRGWGGRWERGKFGLAAGTWDHLLGGDVQDNLAIFRALLAGRGPASLEDTIVLNAAVALFVAQRVSSVEAGVELARSLLLGGAVEAKLAATREFYLS
ncbi:anthranilate phosphoribosyltransferase [Horticoccus luteus]|uniref:Anthranilate phosphoribosyltransferase n=1 Tax=Horticoccus luteus TaxID=2862869 RepID=A0A8F9TY67_9BACT|nr:anthranilate phosphoribosyltransferase [Horticoccus luteus]QYM80181.1 anthranilate phosphoribosyltransferase [Horticoccus luteus]